MVYLSWNAKRRQDFSCRLKALPFYSRPKYFFCSSQFSGRLFRSVSIEMLFFKVLEKISSSSFAPFSLLPSECWPWPDEPVSRRRRLPGLSHSVIKDGNCDNRNKWRISAAGQRLSRFRQNSVQRAVSGRLSAFKVRKLHLGNKWQNSALPFCFYGLKWYIKERCLQALLLRKKEFLYPFVCSFFCKQYTANPHIALSGK